LNAQVPRLRVLREKKAEDPGTIRTTADLENYFESNSNNINAPDDISVVASEATTSASLFTRYTPQSSGSRSTRTSSKIRRREERKRARGKKGTVYEEEYLVNSIGRLIQRVQDIRDEVSRLIVALMMIEKREEAWEMQKRFEGVVSEIRGCLTEVFAETVQGARVPGEMGDDFAIAMDVPIVEPFIGVEILV
jgi:elongator complex protein 1